MSTVRRFVGILSLALVFTVLPVAAAQAGPPDRIKLPRGWQPEGITTDGAKLYSGSLANGAILRVDPVTGKRKLLARGKDGRKAVGVEYDRRRDVLWVAGGETGVIRAQDADTGRVLRTYRMPPASARFVNDLVVTRRALFATDSEQAELAVIKFRKKSHKRVPPKSALQDGFDLNGIATTHGRLVAVQSNTGTLFRINRRTGVTRAVDLGGKTLVNGDGIEPGRRVLYVVQNQLNQVAVLHLNRTVTRGHVRRTITDADFDVPTTAALVGRSLYLVNARFSTPPTPDTKYWITRVRAR